MLIGEARFASPLPNGTSLHGGMGRTLFFLNNLAFRDCKQSGLANHVAVKEGQPFTTTSTEREKCRWQQRRDYLTTSYGGR
jgi:hypothetical protein